MRVQQYTFVEQLGDESPTIHLCTNNWGIRAQQDTCVQQLGDEGPISV